MPQGKDFTDTLKVGDNAPNFTLKATNGQEITLDSFKGKKNVFLFFYPLDWTPV